MIPVTDTPSPDQAPNSWFTTTHWSVVLAAGSKRSPAVEEALEELCRTYRPPVYAYVRRWGYSHEDAEDATQGFFANFLKTNALGQVQPEKGKFRSFLLIRLKHFLSNEWHKAVAQKRGGGRTLVSLDDPVLDGQTALEPVDPMDPEKSYERAWGMAILERAQQRLHDEYAKAAKSVLYDRLKGRLAQEEDPPEYGQVAAELHCAEATIRSSFHRMRARFRGLVREEVAKTVSSAAEIEEELRHFKRLFSN